MGRIAFFIGGWMVFWVYIEGETSGLVKDELAEELETEFKRQYGMPTWTTKPSK